MIFILFLCYFKFYFKFYLVKSRDEWTLEVMDSGIKYKIRGEKKKKKKEKQLANTKRQARPQPMRVKRPL